MEREAATLGKRLRLARTQRGLTQAHLARAAGLKQGDISKIENGTIQRTTGIARLARALLIDPEWLEAGTGATPAWAERTAPLTQPLPQAERAAILSVFERLGAELAGADEATREMLAPLLQRLARAPQEATHLGGLAQRLLADTPVTSATPASATTAVQGSSAWTGPERRTHTEPAKVERRAPLGVIDGGERRRATPAKWSKKA